MNWNVICRLGDDDKFEVAAPRLIIGFDNLGKSAEVSNRVIETLASYGIHPSGTVRDLLNLALCIYTADIRIQRTFAEDRWSRELMVHLPVAQPALWKNAKPALTDALGFLTGDIWDFDFRSREPFEREERFRQPESQPTKVALFSGGLDSFVGGIDLLEGSDDFVALVGQYGKGSTHPSQKKTHDIIQTTYPNRTVRIGFWVQPAKPGKNAYEDTMRSRSFLFLALGAAVASSSGPNIPLYVAENGLISLNVPLSHSRMGSFSTRTTHPHFIGSFRTLLEKLNIEIPVILPYRYQTKGEMLKGAKNQKVLADGLPMTLSCSRPDAGRYDKRSPGTHCGYCVPCIIRLASMKAGGFDLKGAAHYDIVKGGASPTTARGKDRRGFEVAIERVRSLSRLGLVGEVTGPGPLPHDDVPQYADVYRRGIEEVADFLKLKAPLGHDRS
jgi:7-cyano-7-deazaguanine synthase in queuosine biosynthesis